jgi:1,4-dihydroxy-2-naphthoate octaprenyltransferase
MKGLSLAYRNTPRTCVVVPIFLLKATFIVVIFAMQLVHSVCGILCLSARGAFFRSTPMPYGYTGMGGELLEKL